MKVYRFSETGLDALVKQSNRRTIMLQIGFLAFMIITFGTTIMVAPGEKDIFGILTLLALGPVFFVVVAVAGRKRQENRVRAKSQQYEVQIGDQTIIIKDHMMPNGVTLHRDDIKSIRETVRGDGLLVYSKKSPTAYLLNARLDEYNDLKTELAKWMPFDEPPTFFVGGGAMTVIIIIGMLATMMPFIPLPVSIPVGLITLGITLYMAIPVLGHPAVRTPNKIGSIFISLIVAALLFRRLVYDLVIPYIISHR